MQNDCLIRCPGYVFGKGLYSLQAEPDNWLDASLCMCGQEQLEVERLDDCED